MAVDVVGAVPVYVVSARRVLALLLCLGVISFATSDQLIMARGDLPDAQGGPFILGVSAWGGPDCLGGCLPGHIREQTVR